MPLQYLGFQLQLLLIPFLAGLCVGQIVFEDNIRRPPGFICTTPDRKIGTCERWTQCQSLSQKIKSWDELRSYSCGFAGTEPRVCCPSPLKPDTPSRPTDIVYPPNTNSGSTNTASGNTVSIPRTNPSRSTNTASGNTVSIPRTNPSRSTNTASGNTVSIPRTNPSRSTNTASGNTVSIPRTKPFRSPGNGKPTFLPEDKVYPPNTNSGSTNTFFIPRTNPSISPNTASISRTNPSRSTNTTSGNTVSIPRTNPSRSTNTASISRTNPSRSTSTTSGNTVSIPRTNPSRSPGNGKPTFLPEDCGSQMFINKRLFGAQESEKGSWPWMVVIFEVKRNGSKRSECGGALVTARHVITAAHCVVKRNTITPLDPKRLLVRVGAHDLSDENDPNTMDVGVEAVRMHEDYDNRVPTDDIAVLLLDQPVPFSIYIAPICLPYDSLRNEDLSRKSSTVTGFGLTSYGSYSDVLMEVDLEIQDQEMCRRTYEPDLIRITDRHLCAGTLDGSKDPCQGDSGGPLVTVGKEKRYYLIGIVSFGKNCALVGYPVVYTRVTEYLYWLTPRLAD